MEFKQFRQQLIQLIGVGQGNAVSISNLVKALAVSNDNEPDSFRRGIDRELSRLVEMADGSLKVQGGGRGKPKQFYWDTAESKSEMFESHKPRWHSFAHAMAMAFIGEHFTQFLPIHFMDELEEDIDLAWAVLASSNDFRERSDEMRMKLMFQPSGYDLKPLDHQNNEGKRKIYQALNEEKCFTALYESIHPNIPSQITVSPQRVCYLNHQVLVLSYIHEVKLTKYLELSRLVNVTVNNNKSEFKKLDVAQLQSTHRFKARVHTWVKNYFETVRLGEALPVTSQHEIDDCWIIETDITLPNHFNDPTKPDPFFFANFLGMFADSLEVLEPLCLRQEMIRRSQNFKVLYDEKISSHKVINQSPHDMANQ